MAVGTTIPAFLSITNSSSEPHPIFVIFFVGQEEIPFGIQKDLVCAQSPFYREEFAKPGQENQIELIIKLPDVSPETFGCFQCFIYTGEVYDKRGGKEIPDYPLLMAVWKFAIKLRMSELRVAVLDVMAERRAQTSCIPGTPLLIKAWEETEEGSGLRRMLSEWAAEHMRASPDNIKSFAEALPKQILEDLLYVAFAPGDAAAAVVTSHPIKHALHSAPPEADHEEVRPAKQVRKSYMGFSSAVADDAFEIKPASYKKVARKSEPVRRNKKAPIVETAPVSPEKDLESCKALINRMLTAPSYWTRYVRYFRDPVDPVRDNIPEYTTVVKQPMDLKTIQSKANRGEYATAAEFEADVRLIFKNCYEYWQNGDLVFREGEKFEECFNKQWALRHSYHPNIKTEVID